MTIMRLDWSELRSELRQGFKTLMLHKLRSLLTMLGVVFGVGSVIAMLAVGEGANQDALRRIRQLGSQNIILSSVQPTTDTSQGGMARTTAFYGLTYEDLGRMESSITRFTRTLQVKSERTEVSSGTTRREQRVVGVEPHWFEMFAQEMRAGRPLDARDMEDGAAVCVLTETVARDLLAGREALGTKLRISRSYYEVVGIVTSSGAAPSGSIETPNQAHDVYIPLTTYKKRYGDFHTRYQGGTIQRSNVQLDQIILEVEFDHEVEAVAAATQYLLDRFHKTDDFTVSVPLTLLRQAEATKRTFNVVLGSIAGISLLVGGIGIMNIMLASVTERTREIGIRRAIGARRYQIIRQFLIETATLSMLGGILGIGLGMAVPALIEQIAGMPTHVTTGSIFLALGISVAVGIVFGLYPAVRAAGLDPIQALRHE